MAVTIPSDLVLDVMRNATSARAETARANLTAVGVGSVKPEPLFDMVLKEMSAAEMSGRSTSARADNGRSSEVSGSIGRASMQSSPQVAFEQMVLRNMFESILPAADSGIYGDEGASSGIWRSLAADHLAATYTKAGGLGIVGALDRTSNGSEPVHRGQWPYFEQSTIVGFAV